jgi:hypothetical protein
MGHAASSLDRRTRDEKPFVHRAINGSRCLILSRWDFGQLGLIDAVWRALVHDIGEADVSWLLLAGNETLPSITAFADDLFGVFLVFAFATESELILGLSIWDLVDTEPLVRGAEEARQVSLDVFYVVELRCERIIDLETCQCCVQFTLFNRTNINDNDLPVGLFFVEQGHHTQNLDLLDLTSVANEFADLADVQWIIVTLGLGLGMDDIRVFPGLESVSS